LGAVRRLNDNAADQRVMPHHLGRVILWMTGALLSFSVMAVSIRELGGTLNVIEILTVRAALGLAIIGTVLATRPQLRLTIVRRKLGLHVLRNVMHFAAQYLWAWSLLLLPLATVFSLEFTMPAWTILLAALILGERLTPSRVGAIVLGLVGVAVILRPGVEAFQPAALIVLAAAFGFAAQNIATKKLTMTESTIAIVFWMNVTQFIIGAIGAGLFFFNKIELNQLPAVAGMGLAGLSAHFCLGNAFRAGDASVVVPLDFLRIPLIALVGWWFYGEALDIFVFLGAGIIISGLLWNLHTEAWRPIAPEVLTGTFPDKTGPGRP
jgi:drug/metabolite transporter (DMT)-like permease